MKKISKVLLIAFALVNVSAISANAGEGEATYAVVDSSGVVTNVIVCQASVCGSSGSWNGTMPSDTPWAGQKLVLQVPAHPETGKNQGSVIGTPENPVKYDSQSQIFTQGSASTPVPVRNSETVDNTTLVATIQSDVVTFGPDNFVNGQMQFTPVVTSNTGATISATQTIENVVTRESFSFATPQTVEQIRASITEDLAMLRANLNKLIALLRNWVKN
jgi:hypothetical protein